MVGKKSYSSYERYKMKHFMFDFETLSTDRDRGIVVDCSYMTFDVDRFLSDPYGIKDINLIQKAKLKIYEQKSVYGWSALKSTLEFWSSQSAETKANLKPSKNDVSVEQFIRDMFDYIRSNGKISYWWSRSNTFDPIILDRIVAAVGLQDEYQELLPWWAVRDIRTFIDATLDFPKSQKFCPIENENKWKKHFVAHDSRWDVLAEILKMQAIIRSKNNLENVEC